MRVCIKEANMNISPISFKGRFVYNYNESTLKSNKLWHKNSSVEDTIGSYHSNRTQQAYFADPMERVPDRIKEQADFIVYDNEPAYPHPDEVKENYLGTLRRNFREAFEEVRLYFYRREMGGHADINEAKAKQTEAAELIGFYDRAGDLRYKKETAEDEVAALQTKKSGYEASLKKAEQDLLNLQAQRAHVTRYIEDLNGLKKPYSDLLKQINEGIANETAMEHHIQDKIRVVNFDMKTNYAALLAQFNGIPKTAEKYEALKSDYTKGIRALKSAIKSIEANITLTQKTIAEKTSFIEECKTKLAPLFEELKNFYVRQGIKNIKKGL